MHGYNYALLYSGSNDGFFKYSRHIKLKFIYIISLLKCKTGHSHNDVSSICSLQISNKTTVAFKHVSL